MPSAAKAATFVDICAAWLKPMPLRRHSHLRCSIVALRATIECG